MPTTHGSRKLRWFGASRTPPSAGMCSLPVRPSLVPLEDIERQHIEAVLKETGYNKSRTAEILGIARRTLDRRIAEFGLREG